MTDSPVIEALLRGNAQPLISAANAALDAVTGNIQTAELAYFEPRMCDPRGHFAVLAGHYAGHSEPLTMNVFHHADWHGDRPSRWHGVFPIVDHLVGASQSVNPAVITAFSEYTQHITARCLALSKAKVAVIPTARFLTLPGIVRAVCDAPGLQGAIIGVMETRQVPDCEDDRLVTGAFRASAERLRNSGIPLLLIAESEAIGDWLVEQGFDVNQLMVSPYPAAARLAHSERKTTTPGGRPRFGALGATRPVHNPDLLARYLLDTTRQDIDWLVRLDLPLAAQPLDMSPAALEAALVQRGVELLPAHLDREHYDQVFSELDVMLLPYGERYQTIGSGIFLECLCAGVTPVVPQGSTMDKLLAAQGGGVPTLETLTSAGIDQVVGACCENLGWLRQNARARRETWMTHPYGPARWANRLKAFLPTSNRA